MLKSLLIESLFVFVFFFSSRFRKKPIFDSPFKWQIGLFTNEPVPDTKMKQKRFTFTYGLVFLFFLCSLLSVHDTLCTLSAQRTEEQRTFLHRDNKGM